MEKVEKRGFANNAFRNAWTLTCRNYRSRMRDISFYMSRLLLPIAFAVILMSVFVNLGYTNLDDNVCRLSLLLMNSMIFALLSPVYVPERKFPVRRDWRYLILHMQSSVP